MALELSINVCVRSACTVLVFKDTTEAYDASTNTTGYGTPNPSAGSATAAILTVTGPDEVAYNIDILADGFPTTNENEEFTIPLTDIGNRTNIEDGLWSFTYTVTIGGTDYSVTKTALFTCNSACCVNTMLLNLDTDCDDISTKSIQEYLKAKAFLEALKHYAFCGNLDKFENIKLIIDKLCARSGCRTCN